MNRLRFSKMHGLGNDYVYAETRVGDEPVIGWPELARRVSDRRFGVGGDGLILIGPPQSPGAHGSMRVYNADGSEAEMCGNGLRCVGKYLHDRRHPGVEVLDVDTGAGRLAVRVVERDAKGRAALLEVRMGTPKLEAAKIPTTGRAGGKMEKLRAGGRELEFVAVGMGNPHCVILVADVEKFPVTEIGPLIENDLARFPKRVNVEFVQVLGRGAARQRTWERGSGETLACGTGACAVAVAGQLWGKFDSEVLVHLRGGDLRIHWKGPGQEVLMRGGATWVCDGELAEEFFAPG